MHIMRSFTRLALLSAAAAAALAAAPAAQDQEGFRFRSGVELINVTATVTDDDGRFVAGLSKDDFRVFDDNLPVEITHFSNERVPVSLGIVLDTSGSMTADKMSSARGAIERFIAMLGEEDEMFLYRFANVPELVQAWTTDRRQMNRALGNIFAGGGTAMYDAIADAVPLAQTGRNRKKAIVVISDGNDTSSSTTPTEVRELIRQSEVIVYAIGVDGRFQGYTRGGTRQPRFPIPIPFPGRRPQFPPPIGGGGGRGGGILQGGGNSGDRLDAGALRRVTDDTGGRTEVVRDFRDLDGATARIADELSKQYYLGYTSPGHNDGRWHVIRVEVRERGVTVRARRGYTAS
jgi:Ca-activated chloride channel family protein